MLVCPSIHFVFCLTFEGHKGVEPIPASIGRGGVTLESVKETSHHQDARHGTDAKLFERVISSHTAADKKSMKVK